MMKLFVIAAANLAATATFLADLIVH